MCRAVSKTDVKKGKLEAEELSWIAIRCAVAVATAQRFRAQLAGDNAEMLKILGTGAVLGEMPHFLALDLVGGMVIGEKKCIHNGATEQL